MTNGNQTRLPTSTATPIRLCVYQPTRRPKQITKTFETAFGSLTIDGRLGQAHADLMECLMFCAEKHRVNNGRLEVLVDPYSLRKSLGSTGQYSASQIKILRTDLHKAILTIETTEIECHCHIIEKVAVSKITKPDPRSWVTGERKLEYWVFSQEWTELINKDIKRYYNPIPLCGIDAGSVAGIARHILTHQHQPNGGWKLEGLMKAVGIERRIDKVRQELISNEDALAELGIVFDGDRLKMSTPARSTSASARELTNIVRTRPQI